MSFKEDCFSRAHPILAKIKLVSNFTFINETDERKDECNFSNGDLHFTIRSLEN